MDAPQLVFWLYLIIGAWVYWQYSDWAKENDPKWGDYNAQTHIVGILMITVGWRPLAIMAIYRYYHRD